MLTELMLMKQKVPCISLYMRFLVPYQITVRILNQRFESKSRFPQRHHNRMEIYRPNYHCIKDEEPPLSENWLSLELLLQYKTTTAKHLTNNDTRFSIRKKSKCFHCFTSRARTNRLQTSTITRTIPLTHAKIYIKFLISVLWYWMSSSS